VGAGNNHAFLGWTNAGEVTGFLDGLWLFSQPFLFTVMIVSVEITETHERKKVQQAHVAKWCDVGSHQGFVKGLLTLKNC
jgi:hypothetical protein